MQGAEGDVAARERREGEHSPALKLNIYKRLGVDVEADERGGGYKEVTIRRVASKGSTGDVHKVTVDSRNSTFFYANYFWGAI